LFNGRDLDGWYTFLQTHGKDRDPDNVITIEGGAIHLYKHATDGAHVVMGYIGTRKEFGDYHLRFQYRWGEKKFEPRYTMKRDAGLYYHPKTRGEPTRSFLAAEDGGEPRVLGGKGIASQKHLAGDHEVVGWNTAEVIARGDTTTHVLNGKVLNRGKNVRLVDPEKGGDPRRITRGRIALEIEAAEIYFRNVEIRSAGDAGPASR